jgi:glycine betaine catabolism B
MKQHNKMIQTFTSELLSKKQLTDNTHLFSFSCPEDFTFKAGQFVSICFEIDGKKHMRSYSILNPPSQKSKLDFVVQLIPGGTASKEFTKINIGDKFEMKGSFGHFTFVDNSDDNWFLATGTGVAPLYSMIKENISSGKKFTLVFGVRFEENLFLHEELLALAKKHENFIYIPTLSQGVWDGAMGRFQKHLPENLSGKTFYICGIKEVVMETKELLSSKGVTKEYIKFERYS